MEISSIQNYYRSQAAASTSNVKKPGEENSIPATDTRSADTIDISAEASFKAQLNKEAKTYAANSNTEISSERMSELKQQYQGDACPISGSDIAAKIIAGILGPNVPE